MLPSLWTLVERRASPEVLAARLRDDRLRAGQRSLMMEQKTCNECGKMIPPDRLEALPGTTTCRQCSAVVPRTAADIDVAGSDEGDLLRSNQSTTRGDMR